MAHRSESPPTSQTLLSCEAQALSHFSGAGTLLTPRAQAKTWTMPRVEVAQGPAPSGWLWFLAA